MSRRPTTALVCLALAAGAVAGCGDSEEEGTTGSPAATSPTAAPPAGDGAAVKVTMKDIKYVPDSITVKVGQKIVWENTDGEVPHTVTATDGAEFDSGNMAGGATFEFTPKTAGKIDYVCTIHSGQTGSITVTE